MTPASELAGHSPARSGAAWHTVHPPGAAQLSPDCCPPPPQTPRPSAVAGSPHPPQQHQLHVDAVFAQHGLQRFPDALGGLGRDADGLAQGGDFQAAGRKKTREVSAALQGGWGDDVDWKALILKTTLTQS